MKSTYKIISIILIATIVFAISCKKWIDEDTNNDPDNLPEVFMNTLLPTAQVRIGFTLGGFDIAGVTGMWLGYIKGDRYQPKEINEFKFLEKETVTPWEAIYSGILKDLNEVIKISEETGKESPHYEGIAKILMAYTFGTATQLWGDIPFSEALQGEDNLDPKYDNQEDVYKGIQNLLDEAIADLSVSEDSNFYKLDGDLIFNNDTVKWKKTAYSLKLRYMLHLSKVNDSAKVYQDIIDFYEKDPTRFFESNDDNFLIQFGEKEVENNPLFQFEKERPRYCVKSNFFNAFMKKLVPASLVNSISWASVFYEGENFAGKYHGMEASPVCFMSYDEILYIIAEAKAGLHKFDEARKMLIDAELATMRKLGDYLVEIREQSQTIIDNQINSGQPSGDWKSEFDTLIMSKDLPNDTIFETIMNYKYISLFLNPEAFVDWRRTGYPKLYPDTLMVPRRYPYSSEERLYNKNIRADMVSIFDRNWFDPK